MVESYNCELNSRRLPWGWELTVSSFWLAYLFKCSPRNLYHTNRSKNFIIITIATAGKFISKQLATWNFFFSRGKEEQMIWNILIHFSKIVLWSELVHFLLQEQESSGFVIFYFNYYLSNKRSHKYLCTCLS